MNKTLDELKNFIAKAYGGGEGSRGGKVIGRTKSGKPIYSSHMGDHARFSRHDHAEAMDVHKLHARKNARDGNLDMAAHHRNMADKHYRAWESKKFPKNKK